MIKLADRSEAGWAVVEEYEEDDLADNSEDERRMEKAEGKAEKKLAKKRKLKEAKIKSDFGAKSHLWPLECRRSSPLSAWRLQKVPVLCQSLLQGFHRLPVSNVGTLATGGESVQKWLEVVRILWLIVSMWGLPGKVLKC